MKRLITFTLIIITLFSCGKTNEKNGYNYPNSKVWKHRVNTTEELQQIENVFDGVEVDIIYSSAKNDIYVAHGYEDTINNLFLDEWLSVLEKPDKMHYWVDFKNLTSQNASKALEKLSSIVDKYDIRDKVFIESWNSNALRKAKNQDFHVMLWVDAISNHNHPTLEDTISIINKIRSNIESLEPDAISCVYTMFPILCDTFPEQNIHFWDTPKAFTPKNVEFTKEICRNESVKVVLVDYPTPNDY